ncbi:MAG TPA: AAA family ATPase [Pirellulaceae bacterium]|nr:AAA family ATPase [Pirellulaceae bacterium]
MNDADDHHGDSGDPAVRLERAARRMRDVEAQISRRIVGQQRVIRELMIALSAGGHALLIGVPGLAKTLLIRTLARALAVEFRRIQFTPDLMPADVTGTDVLVEDKSTGDREFRFVPGPVFANVVLADEINRTPPKTQAALLEAMQERQVTVGGRRHPLPDPFFVMATQNPLDQEGTYPLPEAQMDRFLLQIDVGYPSREDELAIATEAGLATDDQIVPVLDGAALAEFRRTVESLPMATMVADYAVRLVRATRPESSEASESVRRYVRWGAGPRAGRHLVLAAKAAAALEGRPQATTADVAGVARSVLRHRVRVNFAAEADGIGTASLLDELIRSVPELAGVAADELGVPFRSPHAR